MKDTIGGLIFDKIAGHMVYEPNVPSNFADQIRPELEKQTGFELPQSTKILNTRYERGLDEELMLKFKIDKLDLPKIIHNSLFDKQPLRNDRKYCSEVGQPHWWKAKKVKNYLSGQAIIKNSKSVSLLIDLDDPNQPIVYFEFF
jgi:hypothetical protein